jgi:hypothetical protein
MRVAFELFREGFPDSLGVGGAKGLTESDVYLCDQVIPVKASRQASRLELVVDAYPSVVINELQTEIGSPIRQCLRRGSHIRRTPPSEPRPEIGAQR